MQWLVLDVRTLHRNLRDDLPAAFWSDQPSVLAFTLASAYANAGECMARALANARAEWRHESTELPAPAPAPQRFILQGLAA